MKQVVVESNGRIAADLKLSCTRFVDSSDRASFEEGNGTSGEVQT